MIMIIIIIVIFTVIILIMIGVDHLGLAKCLPVAHNTTPLNSITIVISIKEIIVIIITTVIIIIIVIKLWLYNHVFLALI